MEQEKNVLITTLGYTKNHLHVEYYSCLDEHGELCFCSGISGAEAGAKYILSRYKIDEIIILGPSNAAGDKDYLVPTRLESFYLENSSRIETCSELDFFCYRMSQYLDRLDIEANDILYYMSKEKRQQLQSFMKKELEKGRDGYFFKAASETEAYEKFKKATKKLNDYEEHRWLKHMMFHDMDASFKLRVLRDNSSVSVRFIPMEKESNGGFSLKSMAYAVNTMISGQGKIVNLYVDLQGMDKADTYTMNSMLSLVNNAGRGFYIKSMIHTRIVPEYFIHMITDEIRRYDFELLLAGMQAFTKYGKVEMLEQYCMKHEVQSKEILDMLKAMAYIDTGVSLCNMDDLKYGIQTLKKILQRTDYNLQQKKELALFSILKQGIEYDYGKLLEGDEVSIPELIVWALRKSFYQQALTMIESLIPGDIVSRGILYYAKDNSDKEKALEKWNVLYWNEIPKCRYVFKNLEHFFIKSYGRSVINNKQDKESVARDLAKTMVSQIKEKNPDLCPVYSELDDDEMLYEMLLAYYAIGNLRNQVSHANTAEHALDRQQELQENKSFELLKKAISRFMKIYCSICEKMEKKETHPVVISDAEFKAYTWNHRLMPFEGLEDGNVLENTCQCQFNGQEVSVHIRMLRPSLEDPNRPD